MNPRLLKLLSLISDMTAAEKKKFMKLLHGSNESGLGNVRRRPGDHMGIGEDMMSPEEFREYDLSQLVNQSRANNIDNYPRAMQQFNKDNVDIEEILEALMTPQKRSSRPNKPRRYRSEPNSYDDDIPF